MSCFPNKRWQLTFKKSKWKVKGTQCIPNLTTFHCKCKVHLFDQLTVYSFHKTKLDTIYSHSLSFSRYQKSHSLTLIFTRYCCLWVPTLWSAPGVLQPLLLSLFPIHRTAMPNPNPTSVLPNTLFLSSVPSSHYIACLLGKFLTTLSSFATKLIPHSFSHDTLLICFSYFATFHSLFK